MRQLRLFVALLGLALVGSSACSKGGSGSPTSPTAPTGPSTFRFTTGSYVREAPVEYEQNRNNQGNRLIILKKNGGGSWENSSQVLECWYAAMTVVDSNTYSCGLQNVAFAPGEYAMYFFDAALRNKTANRILSIDGYVLNRFTRLESEYMSYDMAVFTVTPDGRVQ